MRTDRERVTFALDTLVAGLFPYVEATMKSVLNDNWHRVARSCFRENRIGNDISGEVIRWDAHSLLTVMWDQWNRVFRRELQHHHRSLVSELREFRNRWAHQQPFDFDETYRMLDSAERLLAAVGSPLAQQLHREKRDLLRMQFTHEAREAYRQSKHAKQKWKDLCIYAICAIAIISVVLQLFGWQAWIVMLFVTFVFSYFAYQQFQVPPAAMFGPHECEACTKIIYGDRCPYCEPMVLAPQQIDELRGQHQTDKERQPVENETNSFADFSEKGILNGIQDLHNTLNHPVVPSKTEQKTES